MRFTAWLVLAATLALWSGNWIVGRAAREEIAPGIATVGRLVIVLAILVPFTARGLAAKWRSLSARQWRIFAALGLTGGGVHLAMQWLGLHYTTATSAVLYLSTTPIFILLLAALVGERIRRAQWIGVAISFCGVLTLVTQGRFGFVSFNIGDLVTLASMMMWAGYTVLLRVRRDPLDVAELLTRVCGLGFLFMIPWVAWELFTVPEMQLTAKGFFAIVYSGVGSLLLAYAGWSYVVMRLGAARAGVTLHLIPALGVLLSALFLGEYPRWYHFAGIGLILAGVALSTFRKRLA